MSETIIVEVEGLKAFAGHRGRPGHRGGSLPERIGGTAGAIVGLSQGAAIGTVLAGPIGSILGGIVGARAGARAGIRYARIARLAAQKLKAAMNVTSRDINKKFPALFTTSRDINKKFPALGKLHKKLRNIGNKADDTGISDDEAADELIVAMIAALEAYNPEQTTGD